MSQVAATPAMALPVLEFLSNLIPIPVLYSGFVDQEYLSLFAISIPYTDHNKYVWPRVVSQTTLGYQLYL